MPIPPAAGRRWYRIRSSVTKASGVEASNVAALMTRLRSVTGPSLAAPNTSVNTFWLVFIPAPQHAVRCRVNDCCQNGSREASEATGKPRGERGDGRTLRGSRHPERKGHARRDLRRLAATRRG